MISVANSANAVLDASTFLTRFVLVLHCRYGNLSENTMLNLSRGLRTYSRVPLTLVTKYHPMNFNVLKL